MKSFLTISVAAATMTLGLMAQKLETQKPDSKMVFRVETAKDHLTVIELTDVVTMVAVGNRSAFTVERRENKVFVTPTDEGARTNLFIWTSGGRYAYELIPAADIDQMHFAIDQVALAVTSIPAPATGEVAQTPERLPAEMLTAATPVLVTGERETSGRVEVTVRDLYRKNRRLYLRYAVANRTGISYLPSRPAVWMLEGARAQQSLISLREQQLGEKLARTVKSDAETTIGVVDADQTALVAAGGHGWGWLVLEESRTASADSVAVLRLQFAADAKGTVDAVLVLQPAPAREVAHAQPTVR
ncbi:MAG: TrbG/VirB9 family P-type conjugative transfer protein [Bryobacterales bacterium]|nr:TrbG/VirB9 family P-type conjugative transfer protein [Bryobacterales bacterium]